MKLMLLANVIVLGGFGLSLSSSCGGQSPESVAASNTVPGGNAGRAGNGAQNSAGQGGSAGGAQNNAGQGGSAGGAGNGAQNGGAAGVTAGTGGSAGTADAAPNTGGAGGADGGAGAADVGAGGAGGAAPSVCDGKGTRVLAVGDGKVDDFEGATISPGWSSFNDVMPTPNSFKIVQEAGGAVGTAHSGHYAGTGAKTTAQGGFGVGTVYNVAIDTNAGIFCIDISAFDGVTFWAKAATAGTKLNVNFILPETNQQEVSGGGDCVINSGCFIHPYKAVTLTTAWAQYSVAFADAGMGMLPGGGAATVKNKIQELMWIAQGPDWDFSLDEIQFYKGTPPTGPAGH